MSLFKITRTEKTRVNQVNWGNLGFGIYFSDHVFVSDYVHSRWDEGRIEPYAPMPMEPALCTLHYGQTIFEGLKAFRAKNGDINIFRPKKNAERLNLSAEKLCIPPYDVATLIEAMKALIKVDEAWVPQNRGCSLYIRPLVF